MVDYKWQSDPCKSFAVKQLTETKLPNFKRKLQAEAIYQRPTRLQTSKENRITGSRLSVVIIKTPHTVKFTCTACQYGAASATGTVATEHPGPRKTILCGGVSIIVSIALIPEPLSHLSNGSKKMTDKY